MEGIAYVILLIAVSLLSANGDDDCFYNKMAECFAQNMKQTTPIYLPVDFSLCEFRKQLFTCLRKNLKKCSVEQKYDFKDLENLYHDICTQGTEFHKQMKEHSSCYKDAVLDPSVCTQSIMDVLEEASEFGDELVDDINKKVCKEGHQIIHCYYGVIEEKCGKAARDFVEAVFKVSGNLNQMFCEDLLNEKIKVPFY